MPRVKNTLPDNDARVLTDRARRYCATSEQCESGIRQKLIVWGAQPQDIDPIVEQLRAEGYIDDRRYVRAYCESKMMGQHWGKQKVLYQLRLKHLPKEAIDDGLKAVDNEQYMAMLQRLAERKMKELAGTDATASERRLMTFLSGRGFSYDEINKVINNITQQ